MKIVILDGYTANKGDLSWQGFELLGEVTVFDRTPKELVVERIGDAQIVITNKTVISKDIIENCPNIKYIGLLSTGYNVIDLDSATSKNIVVCNVPAYSTPAVAQMVFALLLEICQHVGEHNSAVKKGDWCNSIDFTFWNYPLIELNTKTMGIIGYGAIGQAAANIAKAFGMKVLVYNKNPKPITEDEFLKVVSLETLLKNSDVISLHCPLKDDTQYMINKDTLSLMKKSSIIINTSRGPLINEQDLADALNSKNIFGAGVDVVSVEPIAENNPLLKCDNCIITPHIAWAPLEARGRLIDVAVNNLKGFLEGKQQNVVNN
ncbi:MAG: D-2-hydroxyacid dehydrogenase [Lachnospirales bacterium]